MPLLSIVIPTKNRLDYVKSAIKSVLSISSPLLQLVIADNSDTNDLEIWIKTNIYDTRYIYSHSDSKMTMCENYDQAVSFATGEYICLIGDDDGVNPEIIDATIWAKKHGHDALVPSSLINYVWPDLQMKSIGSMEAGELSIRSFTGEMTFPIAEDEMLKCVADAGQNFHSLPKAYYGVVKKECFDLVKEKTGSYFPGVSPDMSAALSIATVVKSICKVDYPLFVPGSSAKSNAGLSGMKKHIGRLIDQPHLSKTCEQEWSDITPVFYSVQTIWAEAAVNALVSTGRQDILKKFNLPLLYALCTVFHYSYMQNSLNRFYKGLIILEQRNFISTIKFIYWFIYWWSLRAKSLILRIIGYRVTVNSYCSSGVIDIEQAVILTSNYLREHNVKFKNIFK
jgi:glycosyltransferase involved in cell wall biosynthesis